MVAAFIVLLVVALGGGGYIVFDAVRATRNPKVTTIVDAKVVENEKNEKSLDVKETSENSKKGENSELAATEEATELEAAETSELKASKDEDAQSGDRFKPSDIRRSVTAKEVDSLMKDEVAASLVERSEGKTDRTKTGIINIDALSQNFDSGETVTLEEIKKRVKGVNKNITYIKVLARGTLDKKLTVEADGFSLQAVKMIVLTGGKAIKRQ